MNKAIIVGCLLAGGCTTIADTMAEEPERIYASNKSADALESCLGNALSSLGGPNTIRAEGSRTLNFGERMMNNTSVTIRYGNPNTVEIRRSSVLKQRITDRVEGCL
ncbi:hypothetical protein [Novosphingopyxis iocasae]|uniref:hypothetical protein n=1 Tax=Novosphingopyxis iocasae TaxID=2762729 RepID=UPI00165191D6|nr:hypothetical protein [Novosphingopyxis iocasae]